MGAGIPANPLTTDHLAQINNAIDAANQAEYQIQLAQRAGIDVATAKEINDANLAKLRNLKMVYFPGQ